MLNILLYQDSQRLWEHLKSQQSSDNENYSIVCPSPQIADAVRKRLPQTIQVQTMAGFISKISEKLGIDQSRIKGKSELLFYLSQVAKKQFEISHQEFLTAFHLFTQLRGVSQDKELIETVLDDYVPQLKTWVIGFYSIMKQLGWLDEHGTYKEIFDLISSQTQLAQKLSQSMDNEHIVLYGFKHLTGTQVELFKGFSQFSSVTLPYWKNLYDQSWPTDWIQWFADEASIIDVNHTEQDQNQDRTDELGMITKIYQTSSTDFSTSLKFLLVREKKAIDLMIPQKSLETSHMMMVPHNHLQFKMSYDLFDLESMKIQNSLEGIKASAKKSRQIVFQKIQEIQFIEAQDFREFKLLSIVDEILALYPETDSLETYDWKVIFEILKLDIPRLNLTSFFSEEKSLIRLLSRQNIDDSTIKHGSFLLIDNSVNIFSSAGDLYSENVEKHISSLSPMRRPDVENGIFINQLVEMIQHKKMTILRGDSLLEKDPRWESFFELFPNQVVEFEGALSKNNDQSQKWSFPSEKVSIESPEEAESKGRNSSYYSATRIQSYIDCSYYYYFKYIKNIFPNFSYETQIEPREIGSLEHLVIANYYEKYKSYDEDSDDHVLRELCRETLNEFLAKENKRLDPMIMAGALEEIHLLSQRGIKLNMVLSSLMKLPKKAIFERSIKDEFPKQLRSGSIDYSYLDSSQIILVDFKRGSRSIPSAVSISDFEKIQFLFYLNVVTKKYEKLKDPLSFFMGYFCLGDIEKSHIWADDDLKEALIEKGYPRSMFKKNEIFEVFEKYPEWESHLIKKIEDQEEFKPNPRNKDVCSYCDLNTICHKGVL